MLKETDDNDHRHLHNELERAITKINREQIGAVSGSITKEDFINVVKMVACLRARYLYTVLQLGGKCHSECIPTEDALQLKALHEAYAEAMEGFNALEHALHRGYITLHA